MSEEAIKFGKDPVLAGMWSEPENAKALVVYSHPHPSFGGDMSNNAVRLPCHFLNRAGYATLRYDFRGSGLSGGQHDGGKGARDDILVAITEARKRVTNNSLPLILAGYSFGAWISWAALDMVDNVSAAIIVAPPFGLSDFRFRQIEKKLPPVFAIVGTDDQFCNPQQFKTNMNNLVKDAQTEIIENVDHFWFGTEKLLSEKIISFLDELLRS